MEDAANHLVDLAKEFFGIWSLLALVAVSVLMGLTYLGVLTVVEAAILSTFVGSAVGLVAGLTDRSYY